MKTKQQPNKPSFYHRLTSKEANVWLTVSAVVVAFVVVFGIFLISQYNRGSVQPTSSDAAFFRKGVSAVTSPAAGEVWQAGTTKTIQWIPSRVPGQGKVNLVLKAAPQRDCAGDYACKAAKTNPQPITTNSIPNNGSFSWVVPQSLPAGFYNWDVQIAISTNAADASLLSDAFTIKNGSATAGITIATSDSLTAVRGVSYTATFVASGGTKPYKFTVSGGSLPPGITVLPDTARDCASGVPCLPGDDVIISGTPTTAGTYSFTLTATDGVGVAGSKNFTIVVQPAGGGTERSIKVTSPAGGEAWHLGQPVTLRWTSPSDLPKVNVYLQDEVCTEEACLARPTRQFKIVKEKPNTGSYQWTVGTVIDGSVGTIGQGRYRITVEGGGLSGTSEVFTISPETKQSGQSASQKLSQPSGNLTIKLGSSVTSGDYTVIYAKNLCSGARACALQGGLVQVSGPVGQEEATMHVGEQHAFFSGAFTLSGVSFSDSQAVVSLQ